MNENTRVTQLVEERTTELIKSREDYKQLFDQAADMIAITDLNGNIKDVNKRMCEYTGYSREELLQMNVTDYHVPEEIKNKPIRWDLIKDNKTSLLIRTILTKKGEIKKVEVSATLTANNEVLGIARDKTEIEELYKRNSEIEQMFQAGFENTSIGMAYTSPEGNWIFVNKALSKITGYTKEELIELSFQKISHPDDLHQGIEFVKQANKDKADDYTTIKRYIHKDGHIIWVEVHVTAVRNEKQEIEFLIAHIEDINEKVRLENELLKEKKFSDRVINSIPGILYVTNEKEEIIRVSEHVSEILQKPNEEIIGQRFIKLLDEKQHSTINAQREEVFKKGKSEKEYHFLTKEGEYKSFLIVNTVIDVDGGKGTLGIGIDISKLKEFERQLVEYQSDITERNKELKCLYLASEYSMDSSLAKYELLSKIVSIIPPAFMYPEETYVRITYKGNEYLSAQFQLSKWSLKESILELGETVGTIEVFCSKQLENDSVSPFLKEEHNLILALTKIICTATEKRLTLRNLQKSEEKYRYLFENLPGVIMIWDVETMELIEVNKEVPVLYGYSYQEMIGMSIKEYRPKDQHTSIEKFAKQILTEPNYKARNTWIHLKKNGEKIYMDITSLRINYNGRVAVLSVGSNVTELVLAEEKQRELTYDIRRLKSNIETVRDEERLNLSRELHDDLGQKLTLMSLYLSILENGIPETTEFYAEQIAQIVKINLIISESISTVRNLSDSLRLGVLGKAGLIEEIQKRCEKTKELYKIDCDCTVQEELLNIDFRFLISKEVYRIFQESITNIIRHAEASKILINLSLDNNYFIMEIQDNGKGFNKSTMRKNSLGLLGMQERASLINAEFQIDSELNKGTLITLSIPTNILLEE